MITTVLSKYEILLTSVKGGAMSPDQNKIMALTTVVGKHKNDNNKFSKYTKTYLKTKKGNNNKSQSGNINIKCKNKGKK